MRNYRGTLLAAIVALMPLSGTALAQAWLPPKGEAALSIGWSYNWAGHHLNYLGRIDSPGDMLFNIATTDLGYGLTDRLAVSVNLPYVVSKYRGPNPHPARVGAPQYDTGAWNRTFQDFRSVVRFRVTTGSLAVTPMVALVAPTRGYEYIGHSAPGRRLVEGQIGLNVGRILDPILPRGFAQARYLFAVPEKVIGISHNRSEVSLNMGYFVTDALTAQVFGAYAKTYGGWRATVDFPPPTSPNFQYHDQLRSAETFRLGGGVSYAVTGSIDLGVSGFFTRWAKSDTNMSGVSLSVSYGFSPSQMIKRKKGSPPKP